MKVWQEPVRGGYPPPGVIGYSGLEMMRASIRRGGPRPPLSHLIGIYFDRVDEDGVEFSIPASPAFVSSQDQISVGPLLMVADAALGSAVQTLLPPATPYTTAELSMTFLRACSPGPGRIRAIGSPVHDGRPLALSQCTMLGPDGTPIAHGSTTCFVLPRIEGIEPPAEIAPYEPPAYETPDPHERPLPGETISWDLWRTMSGAELLRRQIDGDLPAPPIHHLTGLTLCEASPGTARFTLPTHEWLCSPLGTVQGGATAMIAHAALATAVTSTLEAGEAYRPVDVKVNYFRPVMADGRDLTATGTVIHRGRTLGVASAIVHNADGKAVASATGSTMIVPGGRG